MNSIKDENSSICGTKIDPSLLSDLSFFVESKIGLHFAKERLRDLERGICSAAGEFKYSSAESFINWLLSAPLSDGQIEMLAGHLTVGETYFFRDKAGFDALGEHVLPELIRSRGESEKRIRIWSAGCSSGEEAYSIAILINKLIPDLKDWSITILATDINPNALKKASKGLYSEWSFRDTPAWIKNGYFTKIGNSYEIARRIRKMVTFSYHNLAADPFPALSNNTSAMDIIFCRNVLMYFSRERAGEVIGNLRRCLVDGGWLLISPVEASHVMNTRLLGVKFPGAILYRKTETGSSPGFKKKNITSVEEYLERIRRTAALPAEGMTGSKGPASTVGRPRPAPMSSKENAPPPSQSSAREEALRLSLLARESANQGRLSDALEICGKAITVEKLNASLYYLQATILQEMHKIGEAAAALKRALYIDHNFVIAHFALGCMMRQEGRHKEAEKHLENARVLAASYGSDDILPDSEGISAGRLRDIIEGIRKV